MCGHVRIENQENVSIDLFLNTCFVVWRYSTKLSYNVCRHYPETTLYKEERSKQIRSFLSTSPCSGSLFEWVGQRDKGTK